MQRRMVLMAHPTRSKHEEHGQDEEVAGGRAGVQPAHQSAAINAEAVAAGRDGHSNGVATGVRAVSLIRVTSQASLTNSVRGAREMWSNS